LNCVEKTSTDARRITVTRIFLNMLAPPFKSYV